MENLTTRVSLILRLQDLRDAEAWDEFAVIYEPTLRSVIRRLGLNEFDSDDAFQEVMLKLSQVIHKWSPDKNNATFRGWLYRVARNTLINYLKSSKHLNELALVGFDLDGIAESKDEPLRSFVDLEFSRQVLIHVSRKVELEFTPTNWQAFWLSYAKRDSIENVAQKLCISKSRVYIARSRILHRLKREVELLAKNDWNDLCISSTRQLPNSHATQPELIENPPPRSKGGSE